MKYIICLFILLAHCTFASTIAQPKKFITIADIHFNPFIGCEQLPNPCPLISELRTTSPQSWDIVFEKYHTLIQTHSHQDTDYNLLQSTLTELHQLSEQQHPTFILILGDFLAHRFPEKFKQYTHDESQTNYQDFTKKTLQYLTYKLNQSAPAVSFYPVIGNNDSYNGNYHLEPKSPFLTDTTEIFSTLIKNQTILKEFKHDYSNAGFYAITLSPHQRIIVLNSILFSATQQTPSQQTAAAEQFAWLQKQLTLAKQNKQHILIVLHIPLGIDVFLSSKMQSSLIQPLIPPLFFSSSYNEKLIDLIKKHSDNITALLSAHTHHDNLQLIATDKKNQYIPSIITASISPIYNNDPGLKIFTYNDQTLELTNYDTFVYPLRKAEPIQWEKEYNFNDTYQSHCQSCTIVNGILNLKKDTSLVEVYKKYFGDSISVPASSVTIMNYWCAIDNLNWKSYKICTSSLNQ